MGFKNRCILVLWTKVTSALEGLIQYWNRLYVLLRRDGLDWCLTEHTVQYQWSVIYVYFIILVHLLLFNIFPRGYVCTKVIVYHLFTPRPTPSWATGGHWHTTRVLSWNINNISKTSLPVLGTVKYMAALVHKFISYLITNCAVNRMGNVFTEFNVWSIMFNVESM